MEASVTFSPRPRPVADTCSDCGRPVLVVVSEQGRRLELDPDPVDGGNIVPFDVDGRPLARVLAGDQLPAQEPAWQRHAATCPESADARRRRARLAPRCRVCTGLLDQALAAAEPHHGTHPACDDRAAAELVRYAARTAHREAS
jgi:hypothetical protein